MKLHRISAYTVEQEPGKKNLDIIEYSKFKYGYKPAAITFAESMMSEFLKNFPLSYFHGKCDKFIVSTSPYWHTPPSAHTLAIYFHCALNKLLFEEKNSPLAFLKIHRSSASVCDFSKLNRQERLENLTRDTLYFDSGLLKGKKVILIEDARITGTHEQKIIDFMEKSEVEELIFVYVVNISFGANDPDVENRINHNYVNSLDVVQSLMEKPDEFILNARLCRFILSWKNQEEFKNFCKCLSYEMVSNLYMSSINDGYGLVDTYISCFNLLKKEMQIRRQSVKNN